MYRDQKLREALLHIAATFVAESSNRTSLITVTGMTLSPDGKNADILVTVLPRDKEKEALDFLKRQRSDFRKCVQEKILTRSIPLFDFNIDHGEINRQKIDELSRGH